jgi:hypothetical protein
MSEDDSGSRLSFASVGRSDELLDELSDDPFDPPENEVPATAVVDAELLSADGIVLFCSSLQVYSNGFHLRLELRARDRLRGGELFEAFHRHDADQVLIGIEYADGRRGRNAGWGGGSRELIGGVMVAPRGGGGGQHAVHADLFVSPLPPPGPAYVVCAWPSRDIPDTRTELPVEEILAAAGRVRTLWPRVPRQSGPPEVEEPEVPEDSWFAR